MRRLSIAEVLKAASNIPNVDQRAEFLRAHDSTALRAILTGALSPYVTWLLPEGKPPYKPSDLVDQQHRLFTEVRKLYLFIKGGNSNLKQLRRETLFVEMLECLDPEDAKLLLAVKDKKIPYPGINLDLINLAFPGLIPT
jgi:hypothetical protein